MGYFTDGNSEIVGLASSSSIEVVGLYDQGKDSGLMRLGNSREGACIALCLRWLGCTMLKQAFWETTFAGPNKLKDPGTIDKAMGWLTDCSPTMRNQRTDTLASNLGLSKFIGDTISGINWKAGTLEGGNIKNLAKEVFDADCHCLFGLATGATVAASSGSGHAVAFIKMDDNRRKHFDPNFGEFIVADDFDIQIFVANLWTMARYNYKSFTLSRYHPRAM
jgi:hypothetical protein